VPDVQIPNNRVVEDMSILYEKKEFTDCIIEAGEKEFKVKLLWKTKCGKIWNQI